MTRPTGLVAAGDPILLARLADAVLQAGAEVIAVRRGVDVLHYLTNVTTIGMVVADVAIEPPNGLRMVALARLDGFRKPFLLVTASRDEGMRRWAMQVEGVSLWVGPFEAMEMTAQIERLAGWVCSPRASREP